MNRFLLAFTLLALFTINQVALAHTPAEHAAMMAGTAAAASRTTSSLAALKHAKAEGAPEIGGPFTLVDESGKPVTQDVLKGKYSIVFFGFTNCTSECPMAMSLIADAYAKLTPAQQANLQVVMITVDPKNDTPEAMRKYVTHFNPAFRGFTGTDAQIESAANHYLAYHAIKKAADASATDQVAHSSFIYLMDKNGQYLRHFPYNEKAETFTAALKSTVK